MARLDDAIWLPNPAGGVGPTGWLGSALIDPPKTFYAPLQDYHLSAPDVAPEMVTRCPVVHGKQQILAQTSISSHSNVLSSALTRVVADADWMAVAGRAAAPSSEEQIVTLYCPMHEDRRVALFQFWWSSATGREDQELQTAVAFISAHELALLGFVGVVTATDDEAVIERYTIDQPIVRSPWDRLVELGRQGMVTS